MAQRKHWNQKFRLSPRDLQVLQFIWKWKIVTTGAVGFNFFGSQFSDQSYRRLEKLRISGYVGQIHDNNSFGYVWTLKDLGFNLIREQLPAMAEVGFKSESIRHDLICAAVQTNEQHKTTSEELEIITEQQLLRLDEEALPEWIPSLQLHRPDGYWRLNIGELHHIFALEVELTQKRNSDYQFLAKNYDSMSEVDRVLWVTSRRSLGERINHQIKRTLTRKEVKHNFITGADFVNHGWGASISEGPEKGKTIRDLLQINPNQSPTNLLGQPFLDTRKSPRNPTTSSLILRGAFRD